MADAASFADVGLGFGGVAEFFSGLAIIMPVIIVVIMIIILMFVLIMFMSYKYEVEIHSQRAVGAPPVIRKDKGRFARNRKTGIESLRMLKNWKLFCPPLPNEYIERAKKKDKIYLFQSSGREVIPMTYANHTTYYKPEDIVRDEEGNIIDYKVEGNTDKRFIVHDDWIKNWLGAEAISDRNRFSAQDWIDKYGPFVIPMILVAAFIFTMHYSVQIHEQAMKFYQSAVASGGAGQVVSLLLPIYTKWFKRK